MTALVWLLLGAALLAGEAFTLTLVLGLLGAAALLTGIAAALGLGTTGTLLVFSALAAGSLTVVRPVLQNRFTQSAENPEANNLIGNRAKTTQQIDDDNGQVRINGELWRARPYIDGDQIPAGTAVRIGATEGTTLLVYQDTLQ